MTPARREISWNGTPGAGEFFVAAVLTDPPIVPRRLELESMLPGLKASVE
jgi:hypothetical protein